MDRIRDYCIFRFFNGNEKIIHILDGMYDDKAIFLLSTDKRIIFKGIGIDFMEVIPHDRISLINLQPQNMISVSTDEKIYGIAKVDETMAVNFVEIVNAFIFGSKAHSQNKDEESSKSVLILLEQLGGLRENGILTEEEFSIQKKKLLEKL
ncbi:SHOCT domain-containing protein [Chryseobacterium sp. MMS23-Vi53]|uniref:SHOCT domain-containing protein n=1 Tax=Chryseobacterium sp. MMS23-Vi53 TaxID=3386644 RepID=UPI0039E9630C